MQRSDFDFDVISGPALPPLPRPPAQPPIPAGQPALDRPADRPETPRQ